MIVSIKLKNKLSIKLDKFDSNTPHKHLKSQVKIRGALHQETNYGKTKDPKTRLLRDTKTIDLSDLKAKDISQIIDEIIKNEIDTHKRKYESMKEAFTGEGLKAFNENRFQRKKPEELKPPVYKVKIWYSNKEDDGSTLQRLYENNEKLSVVTGDNYLFIIMEKTGKKGKERVYDIASLYDSADIAKRTLQERDKDYIQRICEDYRIKHKENPEKVLFTLQQGDLVYLPENSDDEVLKFDNNELKEWLSIIDNKKKFSKRIYKVAKFTGKDCHFIPHNYATSISVPKELTEEQKELLREKYKDKKIPKAELNFVEYGSYRDCSPYESGEKFIRSVTETDRRKKKQLNLTKIQDTCIKLSVDWIGNISKL